MKYILLAIVFGSSLALARTADHLVRINWQQKFVDLDNVNDFETVKIVLPGSARKINVKITDEAQMVTPCQILKVEQTNKQSIVVLQLGETNRDDGANSCTATIKGDKTVEVTIGYYIAD